MKINRGHRRMGFSALALLFWALATATVALPCSARSMPRNCCCARTGAAPTSPAGKGCCVSVTRELPPGTPWPATPQLGVSLEHACPLYVEPLQARARPEPALPAIFGSPPTTAFALLPILRI